MKDQYIKELGLERIITIILRGLKLNPSALVGELIYDALDICEVFTEDNLIRYQEYDDLDYDIHNYIGEYLSLIFEQIGGVNMLKNIRALILTNDYHLFNEEVILDLTPNTNREVINMWEFSYDKTGSCSR